MGLAACGQDPRGCLSTEGCLSADAVQIVDVQKHRFVEPLAFCNAANRMSSHPPKALRGLSYDPARFEDVPTIDNERSQARYSRLAMHINAPDRCEKMRQSKVCEEWLNDVVNGQSVVLLTPLPEALDAPLVCKKVPAVSYLERDVAWLTIMPTAGGGSDTPAIVVPVETIHVICPAIDVESLHAELEDALSSTELRQAVLLEYVAEGTQSKRIVFLEQSDEKMERFVQALSTYWFQVRSTSSVWY